MNNTYDCAVLLTCGMKQNQYCISGWKPDLDAHIRTTAAAKIYEQGVVPTILIAGGKMHGENNPALSDIVEEELVRRHNVPETAILKERQSVDTTENAEYCAQIIKQEGLQTILVVTNAYHLPRAITCFRNHGINADGYSAEDVLASISYAHKRFAEAYQKSDATKKKTKMNKLYHAVVRIPVVGEKLLRWYVHRSLKR